MPVCGEPHAPPVLALAARFLALRFRAPLVAGILRSGRPSTIPKTPGKSTSRPRTCRRTPPPQALHERSLAPLRPSRRPLDDGLACRHGHARRRGAPGRQASARVPDHGNTLAPRHRAVRADDRRRRRPARDADPPVRRPSRPQCRALRRAVPLDPGDHDDPDRGSRGDRVHRPGVGRAAGGRRAGRKDDGRAHCGGGPGCRRRGDHRPTGARPHRSRSGRRAPGGDRLRRIHHSREVPDADGKRRVHHLLDADPAVGDRRDPRGNGVAEPADDPVAVADGHRRLRNLFAFLHDARAAPRGRHNGSSTRFSSRPAHRGRGMADLLRALRRLHGHRRSGDPRRQSPESQRQRFAAVVRPRPRPRLTACGASRGPPPDRSSPPA